MSKRIGSVCRKTHRQGADRSSSPESTLERVRTVTARMGITRIANITGLDRIGIPVVAVTRPNSRSLGVAQGKGVTLASAKASGVMEAIEGFHAETIEAPLLLATYQDLRSRRRVVNVDELPKTRGGSFDPSTKLLWIEGVDLASESPAWVPFEMVHADYTLPLPTGSGSFLMSSNGLASGNHFLEAMSHGICELVERDATALWAISSISQKAASRMALSTIEDAICIDLLEKFDRAAVEVCLWDMTSDIGIPCFRCEIADRRGGEFRPVLPLSGFGCHPRREIAAVRALTEAAQGRLTLISGARDDLSQWFFNHDESRAAIEEFEARRVAPGTDRNFRDVPTWNAETVDEDVQWELSQLGSVGLTEVVVVDLTKPQFEIPVARVVIPGLESLCDAPGYVPGQRARMRKQEAAAQ